MFRAVDERSDIVDGKAGAAELLESASGSDATVDIDIINNDDYIYTTSHEFDSSEVPSGELWNENAITIYATPDTDICIGGGLTNLGEMYWQTSDPEIIAGF